MATQTHRTPRVITGPLALDVLQRNTGKEVVFRTTGVGLDERYDLSHNLTRLQRALRPHGLGFGVRYERAEISEGSVVEVRIGNSVVRMTASHLIDSVSLLEAYAEFCGTMVWGTSLRKLQKLRERIGHENFALFLNTKLEFGLSGYSYPVLQVLDEPDIIRFMVRNGLVVSEDVEKELREHYKKDFDLRYHGHGMLTATFEPRGHDRSSLRWALRQTEKVLEGQRALGLRVEKEEPT